MPSLTANAASVAPSASYPDAPGHAPVDRALRVATSEIRADPFGTLGPQGLMWALDGVVMGHIWLTGPDFTTVELWFLLRWALGAWAAHATVRAARALHPPWAGTRRPTLVPFVLTLAMLHLLTLLAMTVAAIPAAALALVLAGRGLVVGAAGLAIVASLCAAAGFSMVRALLGEAPLRVVWSEQGVLGAFAGAARGWRPFGGRLRVALVTDALWLLSIPLLTFPLPLAMALRATALAPPRSLPEHGAGRDARR